MSHFHQHRPAVFSVCQTLDEMEFERGIWSAVLNNDLPRVKYLLLKNCTSPDIEDKSGYTALHYAARVGNLEICNELLKAGASVNKKTRAGGATPLHRAALAGHSELVKCLLRSGGDPLEVDVDARIPLHRAVEGGNLPTVLALLNAAPMAVRIMDNFGKTPLDFAMGNLELEHYLR